MRATHTGDLRRMAGLLDAGVPADSLGTLPGDGWLKTPLWVAVDVENLEAIRLLLSRGATPTFPCGGAGRVEDLVKDPLTGKWLSIHGSTALHHAAMRAMVEVVDLFLNHGGAANARTSLGNTPLHYATEPKPWLQETRMAAVGRRLLAAGADPTIANDDGKTPLGFAKRAKTKALKMLFTPQAKAAGEQVETWTHHVVRALQDAGLLLAMPAKTPSALMRRLEKALGESIEPKDPEQLLRILALDEARVFWKPLVCTDDVPPLRTSGYYSKCLKAWGRISRGAFKPTKLAEQWTRGGLTLAFDQGGVRHTLKLGREGAVDLAVLDGINRIIQASGRQFASYTSETIDTIVICVTRPELAAIQRAGMVRLDAHTPAAARGARQ